MQKERDPHGRDSTGGSYDRHAWVAIAEPIIASLIDSQLAAPHVEIETRLFEEGMPGPNGRKLTFFPHIISEAVNNLVFGGTIELVAHETKGEDAVQLYIPTNTQRRNSYIQRALGHKGMLYARFVRCSRTFGDAGESVLRRSLTEAALSSGYLPIEPGFAEVRQLGGCRLYGALDSGAWATVKDRVGIPRSHHALLMEMKNRRLVLYPRHKEVYQLLAKAAEVQRQHPDLPVVPLLICRRAHDRLFWMAKDLGFLASQTKHQYMTLPKKVTLAHVESMRSDLGLADLQVVSADAPGRIGSVLTGTVPKQAASVAARWKAVGSQLIHHYDVLRSAATTDEQRNEELEALRTNAEHALAAAGVAEPILAWALPERGGIDYEPDDFD